MHRQKRNWIIAAALMTPLSLGLWGYGVMQDRAATLADAEDQVGTTARLVDEHAQKAIQAGEQILDRIIEIAETTALRDPVAGAAASRRLQALVAQDPQIGSAWVLDGAGNALLDSRDYPPIAGNAAHREYFRAHRDGSSGTLVGATEPGSVVGNNRFTLSRRLNTDDGSFAGVAAVGIYSDYFATLYREATLEGSASIRLYRSDGRFLAGTSEPQPAEFAFVAELIEKAGSLARSGTLTPDSMTGDILAWRVVTGLPIIAVARLPVAAALADWQNRSLWSGAIALAAVLGFLFLAFLGVRGANREQWARNQLQRANATLEARVRERTVELEALYRDSPVGLALLGPGPRYLRINDKLAELNGIPVDQHVGRLLHEVVPAIAGEAVAGINSVFRTGTPVTGLELRGWRPSNQHEEEVRLVDYYPVKASDGSVAAVGAIVRDISQTVKDREALIDSEARYRALTEAISTVIWTTGPDGRVDEMPRWQALTGQSPESVKGHGWLDAVHPDDRGRLERRWTTALETRTPLQAEFRLCMADGRFRWFSVRIVPVFTENGALKEWVGVVIDIDDRRRSQERQQLLMSELDHRVRNILASIQSMVSLTGAASSTKEELVESLRGRFAAMARAHGLLTQQRWEGASLTQIVTDELGPYHSAQRLIIDGPQDRLLRPKEALSFALVIHELATNAAKYGALSVGDGEVCVSWREEEGMLRLVWQERGGPTVAPPARSGFGTTLIARALADDENTSVTIDYLPEGVRCTILMPLERTIAIGHRDGTRVPEQAHAESQSPSALAGTRILLVEDEPIIAFEMRAALEDLGATVVGPARTVREGMSLAGELLDAAVLDVNLNGDFVFPLADALAARSVPILFLSGYDAASMLPERFRDRPAMQKPVSGSMLEKRLAALLAEAGAIKAAAAANEVAAPCNAPVTPAPAKAATARP